VELNKVGEVMRLYCKALTGRNVSIQTTLEQLAEKGIGWVDEHRASTDGSTIFLPELMERFHEKDENFAAMKVFATHQAAHLEFGSFDFDLDRPGAVFQLRRTAFVNREAPAMTDMEEFFDLFPDRQLASDLFTIAEDSRIDARVKSEYGGIGGRSSECSGRSSRSGPTSASCRCGTRSLRTWCGRASMPSNRSAGQRTGRSLWPVPWAS
jgi:nitric oxide reductase NorD protein